ncbi:MAG: SDR family oxidoreductase [Clostridia bacterium]|nr:SDR family oxidoreductase [Clostridia bacterium]
MEENKVVIVTGAGRGIGAAVAKELAKEKYNVVVCYNQSSEKAKNVYNQLVRYNTKPMMVKCDISNEQEIKQMVESVFVKYGRIDALVNNAAVCYDDLFQNKTVENFKETLNVNVVGTFLVSKYVGEIMYNQKSGKIVNLSSTNGINTYFPMCVDYDASKAAINSLTHNLAIQFAPYVNVNAIAPGFIATESEISGMDEEFIKLEEEKILLKRAGTEQDVANLVKFLISDQASFINNQVIKINGGFYGDC